MDSFVSVEFSIFRPRGTDLHFAFCSLHLHTRGSVTAAGGAKLLASIRERKTLTAIGDGHRLPPKSTFTSTRPSMQLPLCPTSLAAPENRFIFSSLTPSFWFYPKIFVYFHESASLNS
jgi:hypothetical protein